MRASGNGTPKVCADNLLKMFRGEIPFERIKGIDPRIIDKPISEARIDIHQDAEWLISTYEPRVDFNDIIINELNSADGGFSVTADVIEKEVQ